MERMVTINGEKLRELITDKGVSIGKVSQEVGFDRGYITKCTRDGRMSKVCIKALEHAYDINPNEYTIEDKRDVNDYDGVFRDADDIRGRIREVCGTQRMLGLAIGRSESYISEWLNGNTTLSSGDVIGIAKVLKVDRSSIPSNVNDIPEPEETQAETQAVDLSEVIDRLDKLTDKVGGIEGVNGKLDELNAAVKLIGNLLMQVIENQRVRQKPVAVAPEKKLINI